MKKIICTLAVLGAVASSFAQGYVTVAGTTQNFTNNTLITASWTGGSAASGNGVLGATTTGQSYKMALLTSTAANPILTLFGGGAAVTTDWLNTGLLGGNNTFAGRLTIGAGLLAANAPIGNVQKWILVAWSAGLGADWNAVSTQLTSGSFANAGFIGWSTVGTGAAAAAAPTTPLIIQGTGGIIPGAMSLYAVPVPEPSTLALAGLGGLALLALRRRK